MCPTDQRDMEKHKKPEVFRKRKVVLPAWAAHRLAITESRLHAMTRTRIEVHEISQRHLKGVQACEDCWRRLSQRACTALASLPDGTTTAELEILENVFGVSSAEVKTTPVQPLPELAKHQGITESLQAHRQAVDSVAALVAPLRYLRESLVSNKLIATPLAAQVFELSCDVAAVAGRGAAPELFKALQGLVTEIYPQLCNTSQNPQEVPSHSKGGSVTQCSASSYDSQTIQHTGQSSCHETQQEALSTSAQEATPPSTSTHSNKIEALAGSSRHSEILAAYMLFFAVAPAKPPHSELCSIIRGLLNSPHWSSPAVQWSLKVTAALSRADWLAVWRLRHDVPSCHSSVAAISQQGHATGEMASITSGAGNITPTRSHLLRELLDYQLHKVQRCAAAACAATYRTLPWTPAAALLGLDSFLQNYKAVCQDQGNRQRDMHGQEEEEDQLGLRSVGLLCGMLQEASDRGSKGAGTALTALQQQLAETQPCFVVKELVFKT